MKDKYWALIGIGTSTLVLGTGIIFSNISNYKQHKKIDNNLSALTAIAQDGRNYAGDASRYAKAAKENSDSLIVLGNKTYTITKQTKRNTSRLSILLNDVKENLDGLSVKMSGEHNEQDSLTNETYTRIDEILDRADSTITEIDKTTIALAESTNTINKNIKKLEKNQYKERRSLFWGFIKY